MVIFEKAERPALYVHLRTFESDFDKSQSQIRAISSAWSVAVLAAIALVITTAATPIVKPTGAELVPDIVIDSRIAILTYLRVLICMVGSAGVLAFWYIDQGVYQRLLHSVFAYGLYVEWKDEELPQIRSSMFLANLDVTNRLAIFYRAQFWIFAVLSLLISSLSCWIKIPVPNETWWLVGLHVVGLLVIDIVGLRRWPSLDATIRDFYPALAAALPQRRQGTHAATRAIDALKLWWGNNAPPPNHSKFDGIGDIKIEALLRRIRRDPSARTP